MPVQARARELFLKFLFEVYDNSGGMTTSKFQRATGLSQSFGIGTYAEGGAYADMKEPARVTISNVTLERGVSEDESFYLWCLELCDFLRHAPEGAGNLTKDVLRDLDIKQKDRTQTVRIVYPMHSCFPVTWSASEWDNTTDDVQIESLELAQWWFDRETE
uniref:Putative tail tube protein n=1 Tax=viral metagenome TaxID=1070528 RepID=A0A6H1Z8K5_9ZZZZ